MKFATITKKEVTSGGKMGQKMERIGTPADCVESLCLFEFIPINILTNDCISKNRPEEEVRWAPIDLTKLYKI